MATSPSISSVSPSVSAAPARWRKLAADNLANPRARAKARATPSFMNPAKPTARSVLGRVKTSYPRILNLLVPLDFSGKSRQALRYAVPVAQKFSAKVHLVHVLPAPGKADKGTLAARQEKALQRLDQMGEDLLPPKLRSDNLVLVGEPAGQILAAAAALNIDVIVITTKGQTGLKRMLLGSTAESVMRNAACPVMSIRRH